MQRVAAEVLLYDELGVAIGCQPVEPTGQEGMKVLLANANWWVGDDEFEPKIFGYVIGTAHHNVEAEVGRVGCAEVTGALVHIDSPHLCLRGPSGDGTGDRSVAAPDVENRPRRSGLSSFDEQHPGAGINLGRGEDAAIGLQLKGEVRQMKRHGVNLARYRRIVIEVVAGGRSRHAKNLPGP